MKLSRRKSFTSLLAYTDHFQLSFLAHLRHQTRFQGQALQSEYGMSAPGGELFGGNAYELMVERASKVMLVGMANIGGVECHHIAGTLSDPDWQLWIRAEGEPQFCKYVLTDRSIPLAPQFSITFTGWEANVEFPESQFELDAPADAERIELQERLQQRIPGAEPHALRRALAALKEM